jgi:tetratricopeptide (TPR) repeat protein
MKHFYFLLSFFLVIFHSLSAYGQDMQGYELYKSAEKLMKAGKYAEASVFFDKAIVKDPTNFAILYERGRCYIRLRNYEKAAYSFQRVVELKDDYTTAYLLLGYLHNAVNRTDEAIKDYNNAYRYEKDFSRRFTIKMIIVTILDRKGRLKEAEHHLAEAKALGIENEAYLYYQAKFKNMHGKYKDAKEYLIKAIAKIENLHPDSLALEMGEKLFQQVSSYGFVTEPMNKPQVKPNPVNNKKSKPIGEKAAKVYYEMYYTLHKLHQYDLAEDIYPKAAYEPYKSKMDPLHFSYLYNIAYTYYQVHELDRSREVAEELLRQKETHRGATALIFKIVEAQNDKTAIIEQMEAALGHMTKEKNHAQIEHDLLKLYFDAGRYDKVITLADRMIAEKHDRQEALFYKALALAREADGHEKAFEVFEKLIHLHHISKKEKSKYYFALGLFAFKMEKYKKAGTAFNACNYLYYKAAAHKELQKILPSDME